MEKAAAAFEKEPGSKVTIKTGESNGWIGQPFTRQPVW